MLTAKRFAIGVGLALVLPMLVHFGVATFANEPKAPTWSNDSTYQQRSSDYEAKERVYQEREFWIAVPLGLAAIVLGAFIGVNGVGPGLMFGGVFTAMDGYVVSWSELPNSYRFASLLVTFGILLAVGIYKIARESTNAAAERAS